MAASLRGPIFRVDTGLKHCVSNFLFAIELK